MPDSTSQARGNIVGTTMLVFDADEWGGKDTGDNRQFFHPAEVLSVYRGGSTSEPCATVRFSHDGRVSRGHFVSCMEPVG